MCADPAPAQPARLSAHLTPKPPSGSRNQALLHSSPLVLGLTGVPSGGVRSHPTVGATKRGPVGLASMWKLLWLLALCFTPGCRESWGWGSCRRWTMPTQEALKARAVAPGLYFVYWGCRCSSCLSHTAAPALLPCCPGSLRAGAGQKATVVAAGGEGDTIFLLPLPGSFPSPGKSAVPEASTTLLRPPVSLPPTFLLPLQRDCCCLHGAKPRGRPGTGHPGGTLSESAHVPARQWTRLPASRVPNTSPIAEQILPSVSLSSLP